MGSDSNRDGVLGDLHSSPNLASAIVAPLVEFFFFSGIALLLFKNASMATLLSFVNLGRGDTITLALQASDFVCFLFAAALALLVSRARVSWGMVSYALSVFVIAAGLSVSFIYGGVVAGPSGALAYLRSYLVPFMALLIGATISQRIASAPVRAPYVVLAAATLVFLIVELAAPEALFNVVRIDEFSLIKWGEYFDPADFLNMLGLPIGGYVINRLIGPQLHPVSLGYFLLFVFALVLSPERRTVRLGRAVSALVLLLVIAFCSKGAFGVAVVLGGVRALGIKLTPARVTILALVYVVPLLVLATLPFTTAHIHMEGLKAGLSAMAAHPMGTGIGVGGNLSSENEPGLGYESFVGVLFTQLGAFGIAFLAFVLYVIYRSMGSRTGRFFGLGCMLILFNSLLQEEAFSLAGIFLPLTYLVAVGRLGPTINRVHSGVNLERLSGPIVEARPLVD